jgi:TatD DNase family protein
MTTKPSEKPKPALAYQYQDALYLNITHRCPTACEFCIKFSWDYQYRGYNLGLREEPPVAAILAEAGDPSPYSQIVFCGYGESTYRLDAMREISTRLREKGAKKMRLNTIGLGNLINGRNIAPDLAEILDTVSVSLNTPDPEEWSKIHRPLPQFREKGFEGVLEFIRECAKVIPQTFATAVDLPSLDRPRFESLVKSLGAQVRIRPYLDEYENQ